MAIRKVTHPQGARLLTQLAHFKKRARALPPLEIPAHIRALAEKHYGIKFN